ncbi:MAG TPA: hypothetical protein VIH18_24320 [Candidatus Binatia bacterium]|jgi:hypothetical protein
MSRTLCATDQYHRRQHKRVFSGPSDLSLPNLGQRQDIKLKAQCHVLLGEAHFAYRGEPRYVTLFGEDKLSPRALTIREARRPQRLASDQDAG